VTAGAERVPDRAAVFACYEHFHVPVGLPVPAEVRPEKRRGHPFGVMGASGCGAPPARLWMDLDFICFSGAAWG